MSNFAPTPIMRGEATIAKYWPILDKFGGYIAGGYARWMVSRAEHPAEAGDVDIFVPGGKAADLRDAFISIGYEVRMETDNAWSFAPVENEPQLQIIKPNWTGATVCDTLNQFDFSIVQAAILSPENAVVHLSFHSDECAKQLRVIKINDSVRTLLRMMKYARKGYEIRPMEVACFMATHSAHDEVDYDYWAEIDEDWDEDAEF